MFSIKLAYSHLREFSKISLRGGAARLYFGLAPSPTKKPLHPPLNRLQKKSDPPLKLGVTYIDFHGSIGPCIQLEVIIEL